VSAGWRRRILAGAAVVVVAAAVAAGLYVVGPPAEERARRLDLRRVDDLARIAGWIDTYWTRHASLPASLDLLASPSDPVPVDPVTGRSYEYRVTGEKMYEICATFDRASEPRAARSGVDLWRHGSGRQCFPAEPKRPNR
jgi:hypothetical protein